MTLSLTKVRCFFQTCPRIGRIKSSASPTLDPQDPSRMMRICQRSCRFSAQFLSGVQVQKVEPSNKHVLASTPLQVTFELYQPCL